MMNSNKPLKNCRVVELGSFVAAPSCARLLGEWGADVIKVETIGGDAWRFFGPTMSLPNMEDESPTWEVVNAFKRDIALDLKTPEGQKIFHQLLDKADVFITNNRADALKKMKLDYDTLKEKYPRLVYALVTAYGEYGPDVNQPGFDTVAFWGRSGFLVDMVTPEAYPIYTPAAFGDMSVGLSLFGGICAALYNRQQTGKGDKVSISLYGTAIWLASMMVMSAQECYGNKWPKSRLAGNPMAIPYRCKDGEWIIITIIEYARYWATFCNVIDRPDLINDTRFNTQAGVLANRTELIPILEEAFMEQDSDEWINRLRKADIVHDRLRHFKEISTDEQALVNNFVREHMFANGKKSVLPCPPVRSAVMGSTAFQRGPLLGEHTLEILTELGYNDQQIEEMKANKVIKGR